MSEPQTRSVQQLMDLSGRTALVTGGSRGLGLQMAQALGEAGARLVSGCRSLQLRLPSAAGSAGPPGAARR